MRYSYYPGCTMYSKEKDFDRQGKDILKALGIELEEIPNWTCCGTTFPLITDNFMALVAPVRNLALAKKSGHPLVTFCPFCYNVFKRTNYFIRKNPEAGKRVNDFLREDIDEPYNGEVEVYDILELLRDKVGFENIKAVRPLNGKKIASYYGCMLLRPKEEMGLDDPENPVIMDNLMKAIGAEPVDYPFKAECCGSYLSVTSQDTAKECSGRIVDSAVKNGAEAIVVSCPLCLFNLKKYSNSIPIHYFTELLDESIGNRGGDQRDTDVSGHSEQRA